MFLAFQYPMEIPGVASLTFLRAALNAQRKAHGERRDFHPRFHAEAVRSRSRKAQHLHGHAEAACEHGFSGGEKKRHEVLQMALLQPTLCILDETDSGLDIDAIRIAAEGVNRLRSPDRAIVVITHYQRLLNYIVPDQVHVMARGQILHSGGKELALELEESGYAAYGTEAA